MARKVKKSDNAKDLTAAEFMKRLGKSSGLVNIGNKKDEFVSLGDPTIDRALGGGVQKGQILCIRGARGTGKSLIALTVARKILEDGGTVLYLDTENKISSSARTKCGLDQYIDDERLMFYTVDTLRDSLDTIIQAIDAEVFDLIVIDSINGLYAEEQEERDIHDESKVGGYQAKLWSEWLPMVKQRAAINNSTLVLVQQARDNLQSMYGSTESYSGGKAIDHFATTIIRLGSNKKGNDVVDGQVVRQGITVRVDKNNQGALPSDPIETKLYIGDDEVWGIDELSSVFDEMVRLGILAPKKKGSSSYVPCRELCERLNLDSKSLTMNGRAKVMSALEGDEALYEAVKTLIQDATDGNLTLHPSTDDAVIEDEPAVEFEE